MRDQIWIARLFPSPGRSVASLLDLSLGLDVWERHADFLVVAASEGQLAELERRRLATVDRRATREEYVVRMANREATRSED
ncbi:MAG: hypothetical protein ABWY29_06425 [Blastococcus sp.]